MSIEADFDLDKLFLPSWAQESPSYNKYSNYTGEERTDRRERRGDRRGGPARPGRRDSSAPAARGPGERRGDRRGRPDRRGARPEPAPLPQINVTLIPDEKGVESIARQIKMTGRAYPLFDIARLILQKPERQQIKFEVIKEGDKVLQPLFLCALDDSLWLSEAEAVQHVLTKHFDTFYKAEKIPTDPPKGVFTFVAQCGMSGVVLGPPNYHDYQNKLRKLHQERFSRMPFETFKSRVKIVKDEAIVKKWLEEQSFRTEYTTLNVPESEMKTFNSREEVEAHFRAVHMANIIKEVESHTISGQAGRKLDCQPLQRSVRRAWEEQQKFPLKLVTYLSQQFAAQGLQFFKVNKQITHVAVSRPHYLDLENVPVSEGVRKIVEFINAHPNCTRRDLVEGIVPTPAPAEGTAPAADGQSAEAPTPEQNAVIADLHWLIHQGHVIEFANGILETAKKPKPRPEPKKAEPAEQPGQTAESVPNASVETIEPKVAEMEAARPEAAAEPAAATEPAAEPEKAAEPAPAEQPASSESPAAPDQEQK